MCHPIRIGSETVYKFVLPDPVPKDGHSLSFQSGGKDHRVPLYARERKQRQGYRADGNNIDNENVNDEEGGRGGQREEGTLLTFYRGAQGPLASLDAEVFDRAIEQWGLELIIPTKLQRVKEIQTAVVYNGNRFCVVRNPTNGTLLPDTLTITDRNTEREFFVRVNYKGQKRYCARCLTHHVGLCPKLQEFYAACDRRREMVENGEIKTKIFSDSTLRNVDTLGIRADVCAMSGGGLGQIIQASLDDPTTPHYDNIIIFGGTNDIKRQNFTSHEAYAENIDRCVEKVKVAARGDPSKNIVLIKQVHLMEEGQTHDKDDLIRQLYLARKFKEAAKEVPNINATSVQYETDSTGHPSESGTVQIINMLHTKSITPQLIWNPAYLVSETVYKGVESIFRYGCNSCDSYGAECIRDKHSNQLMCDNCLDSFTFNDNPNLQEIVSRVNDEFSKRYNEDYPANVNKRRREEDPDGLRDEREIQNGDDNVMDLSQ